MVTVPLKQPLVAGATGALCCFVIGSEIRIDAAGSNSRIQVGFSVKLGHSRATKLV